MRVVIQRVSSASVKIDNRIKSKINHGLLIFLGIEHSDTIEDIEWLCNKIAGLRIFNDEFGIMNHSVNDSRGDIIVVSQFTLHASTKKGNRPSFTRAAKHDIAIPLYEKFVMQLEEKTGIKVQTGEFGAMMKVDLLNDGPVTIIIDSKIRE